MYYNHSIKDVLTLIVDIRGVEWPGSAQSRSLSEKVLRSSGNYSKSLLITLYIPLTWKPRWNSFLVSQFALDVWSRQAAHFRVFWKPRGSPDSRNTFNDNNNHIITWDINLLLNGTNPNILTQQFQQNQPHFKTISAWHSL